MCKRFFWDRKQKNARRSLRWGCYLWKEKQKQELGTKVANGYAIPLVWPSQKELLVPSRKSCASQDLAWLSLPCPHPHPVLGHWLGELVGSMPSAQSQWWIQRGSIWELQLGSLQQLTRATYLHVNHSLSLQVSIMAVKVRGIHLFIRLLNKSLLSFHYVSAPISSTKIPHKVSLLS